GVRGGDRARAPRSGPAGTGGAVAALRRLVGTRRRDRLVLLGTGDPPVREREPPAVRVRPARAGGRGRDPGRAGTRELAHLAAARLLRLAVLPLPEAEPPHGRAGRGVPGGRLGPAG